MKNKRYTIRKQRNKTIGRDIHDFLSRHNILKSFVDNAMNPRFNILSSHIDDMFSAFYWADSPQGEKYWANMAELFSQETEMNNSKLFLIKGDTDLAPFLVKTEEETYLIDECAIICPLIPMGDDVYLGDSGIEYSVDPVTNEAFCLLSSTVLEVGDMTRYAPPCAPVMQVDIEESASTTSLWTWTFESVFFMILIYILLNYK